MNLVRRSLFPLSLAGARLRSRPERALLAGLGIALGAALLGAVLGGALAAQDRSLGRAIERLPDGQRGVRAVFGGIPAQDPSASLSRLDRLARRELGPLAARRAPARFVLYRETRIDGRLVDLSAADGVRRWVRLRRGRLPRACRPQRCEVLQLAGGGALPRIAGLRLVRVGEATLTSRLPFGDLLTSRSSSAVVSPALRYHTVATPPFLLAEGAAALDRVPALAFDYRTYTWVLPLRSGDVHPWSANAFGGDVERARSTVSAAVAGFDVVAPDDEVLAAAHAARTAGRRLLLLGGEALALLLAFTVLAAARLRRDEEGALRRLTWSGARPWQLVLVTATESAAIAVAGTVAGWALGSALGAGAALRLDAPVWADVRHSTLSWTGLAVAAGVAAGSALVLLAALRARPLRLGSLAVSPADAAAAFALVAIALGLVRGGGEAGRGTGAFLLFLPGLIALVVAVVSARLLVPVLKLIERGGRRGPLPLRLAALSLARNPGHAALTVAFLVVSIGLGLFALTYRSTLEHGQTEDAAFAVPRDAIVGEDLARLVPVVEAASPGGYRQLGDSAPVLRSSGDVPGLLGDAGFTLLGIPRRTLPRLHGFRDDFSRSSLSALARKLGPSADLRGVALPPGARLLTLPVSVRGDELRLRAVFETRRGEFDSVLLGQTAAGRRVLRARIPPDARGGKLVALAPDLPFTGLHDSSSASQTIVPQARGSLTLGIPRADGQPLEPRYRSWTGVNGISPGNGASFRYVLTIDRDALLRPRQTTDGKPVPVVVSPRLARAAGRDRLLPVDVEGQRLLTRVVATATRFPTTDGDFVLADRGAVATALNSAVPGSGVTDEVWLEHRPGASAAALAAELRRPPFDVLDVRTRRAVEHELRADPLARGALVVLLAAAAVALALALAGLLLALATDLRDERGELRDLEAQGARPSQLRRELGLRSHLVGAFGLLGGLAVGAALAVLAVRLVSLTVGDPATATGIEPPPLRLHVDFGLAAAALLAFGAAVAVLVALPSRRAFGSRT